MSAQEYGTYLAVDSDGQPVITECPATGCPDLDLWSMECAPGMTWMVICGAGHWSFLSKGEQP